MNFFWNKSQTLFLWKFGFIFCWNIDFLQVCCPEPKFAGISFPYEYEYPDYEDDLDPQPDSGVGGGGIVVDVFSDPNYGDSIVLDVPEDGNAKETPTNPCQNELSCLERSNCDLTILEDDGKKKHRLRP